MVLILNEGGVAFLSIVSRISALMTPPTRQPAQLYSLAGMRIFSEISLPLVEQYDEYTAHMEQIHIKFGMVPDDIPSARRFSDGQFNDEDLIIKIPEVANYLIHKHCSIVVAPFPNAAPGDVSAILLGTVFGALCHQRGIIPLHASAIDVQGGCVAFTGASGAGKSTLAAALTAHGHQVISDDVCFLRYDSKGDILVWPGIGRIRLWQEALEGLGMTSRSFTREFRGSNKYLVPLPTPKDPLKPRRLRAVYKLEKIDEEHPPTIARVRGAKAIEMLVPNVYRLTLANSLGCTSAIFAFCASLARETPVYQFHRTLSFEKMSDTIRFLENHFLDVR